METLAYFIRFVIPSLLSMLVVLLLAFFNHIAGPLLWPHRIAEPMERLSYSLLYVGPFAFALSFLLFFYGIEILKEDWPFARNTFLVCCVLAVSGLLVNFACLPKSQ